MSLKKDIERAMFTESYNTRIANIADTIGATEEEVTKRIKSLDFKNYVDLMRALRDVNGDAMRSILGLGEAYNMGGTVSPAQAKAQKAGMQIPDDETIEEPQGTTRQQKTQALQRLGRNNLGGSTAQQSAAAIDKAQQSKTLSPIERKAMAAQAANLDALASDPRTAAQFRNLLNKLRQGSPQK